MGAVHTFPSAQDGLAESPEEGLHPGLDIGPGTGVATAGRWGAWDVELPLAERAGLPSVEALAELVLIAE